MDADKIQMVGAFEPLVAKKLFSAFDARGIPFEVESDHSALANHGRWLGHYFGMYPEGSKLAIYVEETSLPEVEKIMCELFPV